jgi:hypothetical protein
MILIDDPYRHRSRLASDDFLARPAQLKYAGGGGNSHSPEASDGD